MKTYTTTPHRCPRCGDTQNRATNLQGGRDPQPGDFSVCLQCTVVSVFRDDGGLRLVGEEEYAGFDKDLKEELETTIMLIRRIKVSKDE